MGKTSTWIDKREERVRSMFSEIAPWYDFLNHFLSLNIDRSWRRRVTELVPPPPTAEGPILDVCTGSGDLALAYARVALPNTQIIGVDFCHELLRQARRKAQLEPFPAAITFLEADAQCLPFPDNSFALVCVAFGLRNIMDIHRGLAEMVRVTRPGGRLAILEFSRPRRRILSSLYTLYFRYLLPLIGQLLCRNRYSAYRYLPESVLQFPDYENLAALLQSQGLRDVTFVPFTGGIATLYTGSKPAERR